jgi:drug/metabolite transporter (DMT)-like permease
MTGAFKGPILLALAMLSFAAMGALVKVSGRDVPFTEIVLFRSVISALFILFWLKREQVPLRGTRPGLLFFRALFGSVALFMFFFAVTRLSVASAILLNQTAPVFVLPLAAVFLKERITRFHILFVSTALVGVALVVKPSFEVESAPAALALASALFAAVAYILVRKLAAIENPLVIVFWFNTVAALMALPPAIPGFVVPTPKIALALLGMAAAATAGQVLMTIAYRHAEAGRLAVVGSLGAVFGAGFDFVIWRHVPDAATAVGGIVVIVSCSLLQLRRKPAHPA